MVASGLLVGGAAGAGADPGTGAETGAGAEHDSPGADTEPVAEPNRQSRRPKAPERDRVEGSDPEDIPTRPDPDGTDPDGTEPELPCPPRNAPAGHDDDRDRPVGMPGPMAAPALGPQQQRPNVLDTVPGIGVGGASDASEVPINVPIVISAPAGFNPVPAPVPAPAAGPGFTSGGASAATPAGAPAPRASTSAESLARDPLPAAAGNRVTLPAPAGRVGYGEYLRGAGLSQIAALAIPGVAGILLLTGAGGLLGYRQAKAAQGVRTGGIARFMN